jgi:hypothetical protein
VLTTATSPVRLPSVLFRIRYAPQFDISPSPKMPFSVNPSRFASLGKDLVSSSIGRVLMKSTRIETCPSPSGAAPKPLSRARSSADFVEGAHSRSVFLTAFASESRSNRAFARSVLSSGRMFWYLWVVVHALMTAGIVISAKIAEIFRRVDDCLVCVTCRIGFRECSRCRGGRFSRKLMGLSALVAVELHVPVSQTAEFREGEGTTICVPRRDADQSLPGSYQSATPLQCR